MTSEHTQDFNKGTESRTTQSGNDVQLPLNFVTQGIVENDDVKVYIHQNVFNAIERFSRSDLNNELGSILIGEYSQYSNKMHVVISHYIEAKHTDATASTLTFTHETWDYIHQQQAALYPNLKILGWQHTHPGYGIFLSNYDVFIQENFFNLPFQVAYVVDPKQNLRGFFQWKGGKIDKLKGYYVYDQVGKEVIVNKSTANSKETDRTESSLSGVPKTYLVVGAVFLSTVLIVLSILFGLMQSRLNEQISRQQELATLVAAQGQSDITTNNSVQTVQSDTSVKSTDMDTTKKIDELMKKIDSQQNQIDEQDKTVNQLRELIKTATSERVSLDGSMLIYVYTVQSGDTLYDICTKLGINYSSNSVFIRRLNGLDDLSVIYPGQFLYLPKIVK